MSESRILPSGRWVTNASPPSFSRIFRALSTAALCAGATALARDAPGFFTS